MLPAQRKKIDFKTMTEEEQKLFRLYGKLPTHKNVLTKVQKDRKYFDSGDYALSKAGVAPQSNVGTAIPSPENIPHASPPIANHPNIGSSSSGSSSGALHGSGPTRDSPLAPHSPLNTDSTPAEATISTEEEEKAVVPDDKEESMETEPVAPTS